MTHPGGERHEPPSVACIRNLGAENERLRDGLRAIYATCDARPDKTRAASAARIAYRLLQGFSHE